MRQRLVRHVLHDARSQRRQHAVGDQHPAAEIRRLAQRQLHHLAERGPVEKTVEFAVVEEQRLHLASQLVVAAAGLPHEIGTAFLPAFDGGMADLLDPPPPLRRNHRRSPALSSRRNQARASVRPREETQLDNARFPGILDGQGVQRVVKRDQVAASRA